MARTSEAVTLAKLAGAAQRAYAPATDVYRIGQDASLPIEIRRDVVAVIEAPDLLRFHIREQTLAGVVSGERPARRAPKRKAKR
jgi:hypothetical protein